MFRRPCSVVNERVRTQPSRKLCKYITLYAWVMSGVKLTMRSSVPRITEKTMKRVSQIMKEFLIRNGFKLITIHCFENKIPNKWAYPYNSTLISNNIKRSSCLCVCWRYSEAKIPTILSHKATFPNDRVYADYWCGWNRWAQLVMQ